MVHLSQVRSLNIWLGDGQFRNTMHNDPFDNFLCQVRATRAAAIMPWRKPVDETTIPSMPLFLSLSPSALSLTPSLSLHSQTHPHTPRSLTSLTRPYLAGALVEARHALPAKREAPPWLHGATRPAGAPSITYTHVCLGRVTWRPCKHANGRFASVRHQYHFPVQASFSALRGEYNRKDTGIVSDNTAGVNMASNEVCEHLSNIT